MLRNILIAAVALSAIAVGSAGTASATGYYNNHYKTYYKPHHKNYVKKHYVRKHFKKHYNYDYNEGYNHGGYYVQNDCGWQTVKVIRWNHGYRYVDFVKTWTCY